MKREGEGEGEGEPARVRESESEGEMNILRTHARRPSRKALDTNPRSTPEPETLISKPPRVLLTLSSEYGAYRTVKARFWPVGWPGAQEGVPVFVQFQVPWIKEGSNGKIPALA